MSMIILIWSLREHFEIALVSYSRDALVDHRLDNTVGAMNLSHLALSLSKLGLHLIKLREFCGDFILFLAFKPFFFFDLSFCTSFFCPNFQKCRTCCRPID